jgi:hypothetical protein
MVDVLFHDVTEGLFEVEGTMVDGQCCAGSYARLVLGYRFMCGHASEGPTKLIDTLRVEEIDLHVRNAGVTARSGPRERGSSIADCWGDFRLEGFPSHAFLANVLEGLCSHIVGVVSRCET